MGISCGYEWERRDHLRNSIFNTCSQAHLGPTREVRDLLAGSEARPADLFIPNWTRGQDTALDVTMVNPLCTTMKDDEAWRAVQASWGSVHTSPLESLGGMHEVTVKEVKKIASDLSRNTFGEKEDCSRHILQSLSILLMKGNAALLLNRILTFTNLSIDGSE